MFMELNYKIQINDLTPQMTCSDTTILKILETVACKHSDFAGYGVKNIPETHLSWVILAWKIHILRKPNYNEKIKAVTWARNSERFTTYRDFEILDEGGNVIITATSKWALINIDKGLAKIEPAIIECYHPETKCVFENPAIEKLSALGGEVKFEYTILRRDIDLNQHMHNVFYLDLAKEALPESVFEKSFANIELMYKTGAKLGEKVVCLYQKLDESEIVVIKSEDQSVLHAVVKFSN